MNGPFRIFASLAAAALLLAGLGFLYLKTQELNVGSRDVVNDLLRNLQQIDSDIDTDVLRSKTGLSNNYDAVARAQQLITKTQESLAAQRLETLDFSLPVAEKALTDAIATKLALVDRFKAQNAIMKNSLRFLPTAAEDVKQKARQARDANGRPVQLPGFAEGVDQVLLETLKLESASGGTALGNVRGLIATLVQRREEYPASVGSSLDIFANHVITVLAQKEREDELLANLSQVPVRQQIQSLGDAFGNSFQLVSERHANYRLAMYGYGAFLLALAAFLFGRRGRRVERAAA